MSSWSGRSEASVGRGEGSAAGLVEAAIVEFSGAAGLAMRFVSSVEFCRGLRAQRCSLVACLVG